MIHNLSFESTYSVRAAAYNDVGYSNYSEEIFKRTKGLVAETVVDGSSMSSSLNSALPSTSFIYDFHRQVTVLVLCVAVFTFRWSGVSCLILKELPMTKSWEIKTFSFHFPYMLCNSSLCSTSRYTQINSTTRCYLNLFVYLPGPNLSWKGPQFSAKFCKIPYKESKTFSYIYFSYTIISRTIII